MRRKEAGFIVAQAAIFVGVIALVALPAQSANQIQVETTSTSSGGQLAFLSGVSPQGLQLGVTLNSSSVQSHGVLRASVEVLNTVNRNVSFSGVSENQNISEWNYDDYFCPASFLLGFAVFQGHFAAGNISSAGPPLKVVPDFVVYCGSTPFSGAVTFLPGGDRAVVGYGGLVYQATLQLNATTKYINGKELAGGGGEFNEGASPGLVGYWNYSVPAADDMNFTSPGFVYFPPGEYTIVAADDWNQYVYATFVVEPPQTTTFPSGASPDGLQLELTLNATTMPSDGAITGQVAVVNTSDQPVTVSTLSRSQNVTEWSNYINVCPSDYFMGYAVFGGHFTAVNISSAGTPLRLVPPMFPQCAVAIGPGTVTFLPTGGQATGRVVDSGEPSNLAPDQLNATTLFCNTTEASQNGSGCNWATPGLVGYWNWSIPDGAGANFGFTSPAFFHFSPGEYTIVAWDDWNQYVYVTFTVRAADTTLTSSITSDATPCGVGNQVITLNNTEYCADDVANDTVIGSPGYSYFRNGSVTFEGVKFQTICPSTYRGCPGANGSASEVTLGIMRLTMTFPDNTNETDSSVIEDGYYAQILSNHSGPKAGMLVEITYGAHSTTHVYLLVEKP